MGVSTSGRLPPGEGRVLDPGDLDLVDPHTSSGRGVAEDAVQFDADLPIADQGAFGVTTRPSPTGAFR
jgi:hypothetical protein